MSDKKTAQADYDKLSFGIALNQLGQHGFITSSICHNYGSVSGCDGGCPQLLMGGCPNPIDVIEGKYKGVPTIDDADLYDELKELYKDHFVNHDK